MIKGSSWLWTAGIAIVGTALGLGSFVIIGALSPVADSAPRPIGHVTRGSWRTLGAIFPRLSPDGTTIAFSYQGALWRMPARGGTARRLTDDAGFDTHPAWSADGRRLAYSNGWRGPLRIIDAQTGSPVPSRMKAREVSGNIVFDRSGDRLLANVQGPPESGQPARYAWSWIDLKNDSQTQVLATDVPGKVFSLCPDGRIVYVTQRDPKGEQTGVDGPEAELWVLPATAGATPHSAGKFHSRVFDLWCAGDEVILVSDVGGAHYDLWQVALQDASHGHRLTSGQADEAEPSVSTDGRWLLYTDNREGVTAMMLRDLSTGDELTVKVTGLDYGVPTGKVRLHITEKGAPASARLSVRQQDGKFFAPAGALYSRLKVRGQVQSDDIFHADGQAVLTIPVGHYQLQATRGLEYRTITRTFDVKAGREQPVDVALERWTDPAAGGWWGGESHIHANYGEGHWYNSPETIGLMARGEGLALSNMVVANSDGDGVFDREFFRGGPDPVSTPQTIVAWNQEFRATLWGHMTFFDLRRLVEPIFTGFLGTTNPHDVPTNADMADHVHGQGGLVNYTHPLSSELRDPFLHAYSAKALPVDIALGKIDSLDINNFEGTVPVWYRFLNCGFRIPASAGTDVFLNRIESRGPPGLSRAYVKLDGALSYGAWVAGLKAGRSFVTNGPMLALQVGGKNLGETLALPRAKAMKSVKVTATASWREPLRTLELVHNGRVIATGVLAADKLSGGIAQDVVIPSSGWLGLRAYGEGQGMAAAQAHSSPIYVTVAGVPIRAPEDASFFLDWIDKLEAKLKARDRVPTAALQAHVQSQLDGARRVYRQVGGRSKPVVSAAH
jgi:TolB protein